MWIVSNMKTVTKPLIVLGFLRILALIVEGNVIRETPQLFQYPFTVESTANDEEYMNLIEPEPATETETVQSVRTRIIGK